MGDEPDKTKLFYAALLKVNTKYRDAQVVISWQGCPLKR